MATTTPLSVRLDNDVLARIEALAAATGRAKNALFNEAVDRYVTQQEDLGVAAREGLADIAAGRVRAHDEVVEQRIAQGSMTWEHYAEARRVGARVARTGPDTTIIWSEAALGDLGSMADALAERDPATARRVLARIIAGVEGHSRYRDLEQPGPIKETHEIAAPGLPYQILYRVQAEFLAVVRLRHKEEDRRERPWLYADDA